MATAQPGVTSRGHKDQFEVGELGELGELGKYGEIRGHAIFGAE